MPRPLIFLSPLEGAEKGRNRGRGRERKSRDKLLRGGEPQIDPNRAVVKDGRSTRAAHVLFRVLRVVRSSKSRTRRIRARPAGFLYEVVRRAIGSDGTNKRSFPPETLSSADREQTVQYPWNVQDQREHAVRKGEKKVFFSFFLAGNASPFCIAIVLFQSDF